MTDVNIKQLKKEVLKLTWRQNMRIRGTNVTNVTIRHPKKNFNFTLRQYMKTRGSHVTNVNIRQ